MKKGKCDNGYLVFSDIMCWRVFEAHKKRFVQLCKEDSTISKINKIWALKSNDCQIRFIYKYYSTV